jgi:hypothetical protein
MVGERDEPFIFYVQPSPLWRAVPVVSALIFLLAGIYLPLRVGPSFFFEDLWWLAIELAAGIAFLIRLAFPPRGSRPSLQIRSDSVRYVPGRVERYLFGESATETTIPAHSKEILLCHSSLEELPDGYKVIIRADDKTEHEVVARFSTLLDAEQCRKISEGITGATSLPVRLVIRRRLVDGTVQETQWIPLAARASIARGAAAVTIAATPFVGGITVGYLSPRPAFIVGVGLVLWLGQMLAAYALTHGRSRGTKYPLLYSLMTFFTFGAAYSFAVVAVAFIRHP